MLTTFDWANRIASVALAAVWVGHLIDASLGMPRVEEISREKWDDLSLELATSVDAPRVTIVVPARDEEEKIEEALRSLLALEYGQYRVIAIDDRSTDRTGEIMDRLARDSGGRMRVLHVTELPEGWLGKTHAMWLAAQEASRESSPAAADEWLLFTDGDVIFRRDSLRRAIAYAERERADHLVLFPTLITESWDERMMISFFQAMFAFSHRPWRVANPKAADSVGVGAFNLVRRSAYEAIGTYRALKLAVIDDMKLGQVLKRAGFAQRNVFGRDLIRIHWAAGGMGIVRNLTKNFFAYLRFNWMLAVVAAAGVLFMNIGPFAGVLCAHGWVRWMHAAALLAIAAMYGDMARRSGLPLWNFFLHPVASALFSYSIVRSTALTLARGGVMWRGTKYSLRELREGMKGDH